MTDTDGDTAQRAELRVRAGVQPGSQQPIRTIREELEDLVDAGHLDDVETIVWGRRIPLDPDHDEARTLLDTFQRFRGWALRNGAELAPAFRVHEVTSIDVDESYPVVTVPMACLALYDDGDVVAVYPHCRNGDVVTLQDGLDRLATDAPEAQRSTQGVGDAPTR
jgi:hypothetical protein